MEGDNEKVLYLQKAVEYSLTGSALEKKCFFLHGRATNNGKSTMTTALLNIFGDYGTSIQANSLEQKQFSTGGSAPSPISQCWRERALSPWLSLTAQCALTKAY